MREGKTSMTSTSYIRPVEHVTRVFCTKPWERERERERERVKEKRERGKRPGLDFELAVRKGSICLKDGERAEGRTVLNICLTREVVRFGSWQWILVQVHYELADSVSKERAPSFIRSPVLGAISIVTVPLVKSTVFFLVLFLSLLLPFSIQPPHHLSRGQLTASCHPTALSERTSSPVTNSQWHFTLAMH